MANSNVGFIITLFALTVLVQTGLSITCFRCGDTTHDACKTTPIDATKAPKDVCEEPQVCARIVTAPIKVFADVTVPKLITYGCAFEDACSKLPSHQFPECMTCKTDLCNTS